MSFSSEAKISSSGIRKGGFRSFCPLEIIVMDIGKGWGGGVPEPLKPSPGYAPAPVGWIR